MQSPVSKSDSILGARPELWLLGILALAAGFRSLGPFLQHTTGDSPHYVALAMKLRTSGLDGYNLRGVRMEYTSLDQSPASDVLHLRPAKPPDGEGDLLRRLKSESSGYYDEPLHHVPYGYPILLSVLHCLDGSPPDEGWTLLHLSFKPWALIRLRPFALAALQWKWVLPALIASLGVVILTYGLGRKWFGPQAGLWAAFLVATHPVDILTAQRIWTDDALMLALLAALWLGWRSLEKGSPTCALGAGLCFGIAYLFKPSAGIFGVAVLGAECLRWIQCRKTPSTPAPISMRLCLLCGAGVLLATTHWFWLEWETWGTIIHQPVGREVAAASPWHQRLLHRPPPIILYSLGLALLSPGLALACHQPKDRRVAWILAVAACYTLVVIAIGGREYRYSRRGRTGPGSRRW